MVVAALAGDPPVDGRTVADRELPVSDVVRLDELVDDQSVGQNDDGERNETDKDERQPSSDSVLEITIRLRTTADSNQLSSIGVVLEVTCPHDVQVLGDGEQRDEAADENCSSRNTDGVFT